MLRDNNSLPWDLMAAALLSVLTFALATLPSEPILEFAAPLGIALVLLLPGYALALALFPRISDLTNKGRATLSVGLSLAIAVMIATGLVLTTGSVLPASLAQALSITALALTAAAYLRRSALPSGWRFVLDYRRDLMPIVVPAGRRKKAGVPVVIQRIQQIQRVVAVQRNTTQPNTVIQRNVVMALLAMAIIIAISAFAYTNYANITITPAISPNQTDERSFTEFNVLDRSNGGPALSDTGKGSVIARIINHEHHIINYTIRLVLDDATLIEKKIKLDHNRTWEGPISYTISNPKERQRLDILLYKDGDFSAPYKEKHIWIDASGSDLKQAEAKDKTNQPALKNDGGSKGETIDTQNTAAEGSTAIENPQEPPVNESATENKEVKQTNSPATEQQNSSQIHLKENISENSPENFSAPGAYWEDSPAKAQKINVSTGNIALNVSKDIKVMNASDIDQETQEYNSPNNRLNSISNSNSTNGSFNNSASISSDSYSNNYSNNKSASAHNIEVPKKSRDRKHNLSINKSILNSSNTVQRFYTRPKPGSVPPKGSAISATLETDKSDTAIKSKSDNNGVYRIQSAANDSRPVQKPQVQETILRANNSTNSNLDQKIDNQKIDQKANTSNRTEINASRKNIPEKLEANLSQTGVSQDKAQGTDEPVSEMKDEIDSWVSKRGMKALNNGSQSYESKNIQFVKETASGDHAVLGDRSTKGRVVLG